MSSTAAISQASSSGGIDDTCFSCPFNCPREFSTKIGLGLHKRKAHPAEFFEQEIGSCNSKKRRWTDYEVSELAHAEVDLLHLGVRFMNQELVKLFPERTLDSIKGKRKAQPYKTLVAQLYAISRKTPPNSRCEEAANPSCEGSFPKRNFSSVSSPDNSTDAIAAPDDPDNTLIIGSLGYYLSELNDTLPVPSSAELSLLDEALLCCSEDPERAKTLSSEFLCQTFKVQTLCATNTNGTRHQKKKKSKSNNKSNFKRKPSNRRAKREAYAKLQKIYEKNRKKAYEEIFSKSSISSSLTPTDVFSYWENLLTKTNLSKGDIGPPYEESRSLDFSQLMSFVTIDEIKQVKLPKNTSPGPDSIPAYALGKVPVRIFCKFFTLWLNLKWLPTELNDSRTVFLPKGENICDPASLRPISITSVITRLFHKVLNNRLLSLVKFEPNQFGFQSIDGTASGITLLDKLFSVSKNKLVPFSAAFIDLKKAFDSVSHSAIFSALLKLGIPTDFVGYLKYIYAHARTFLVFKSFIHGPVYPTRGVRQGDPLSPTLFLLVFDFVLRQLKSSLGINLVELRLHFIAYADDLMLVARDSKSLQALLAQLADALKPTGLEINIDKSVTLVWMKDAKRKRLLYDANKTFSIENRPLRCLQFTEAFNYLGATFTPNGRSPANLKIEDQLQRLLKSPLKPQQKLFFLRAFLLPKYYHELIFARIHLGFLRKTDLAIRRFIRTILHLPNDIPLGFFYARVRDGGLGIPCLRWFVPILARRRIKSYHINIDRKLMFTYDQCTRRVTNYNFILNHFKRCLYSSCDGAGLNQSNLVPGIHRWVSDGTRLLSGRDYISSIHVKINCLYNKSRVSRGRQEKDKKCSRNCNQPETLNHILQQCHSTHFARIKRHDDLVSYIARALDQKGFSVQREKEFLVNGSTLKPDLVAFSPTASILVDAQVINDQFSLEAAHENKIKKYEPLRPLISPLRSTPLLLTSFTINWRGVISSSSFHTLSRFHLLNSSDFLFLSLRTLAWARRIWKQHHRMTSSRLMKVPS